MIDTPTFSLEVIFEEIVERGLVDSAFNREAFFDLVEEVLEEHREVGEIHDDQNYEAYETQLKERWPEYESRVAAR